MQICFSELATNVTEKKLFFLHFFRLQKFKLNIANTVITQDNSSLQSMDTSQLFDLFNADSGKQEKKKPDDNKPSSAKSILENMEELWDTSQYEEEYNLDNFMVSLK